MNSGLRIARASDRPAYQQIIDQIKRLVAVGDWTAGSPLPSIRSLAGDLRVSVITVRRSYLELEREGVIETKQGLGSFVAGEVDLEQRLRREEVRELLQRAVEIGYLLGLRPSELEQELKRAQNNWEEKMQP